MVDVLTHSPSIVMQGEYPLQMQSIAVQYNVYNNKAQTWRTNYRQAKLEEWRRTSRQRAFGFKVKLEVLRGLHSDSGPRFLGHDRVPEALGLWRCLGAKVVCLSRRNWVQHAVSRVRHSLTYQRCRTWTPKQGDLDSKPRCNASVSAQELLPIAALKASLNQTRSSHTELHRVCRNEKARRGVDGGGQPHVLQLAYEDLAYGNAREERWMELQRWLGVPPVAHLLNQSTTVKMTRSRLSEALPPRTYAELSALVRARYGETGLRLLREGEDIS